MKKLKILAVILSVVWLFLAFEVVKTYRDIKLLQNELHRLEQHIDRLERELEELEKMKAETLEFTKQEVIFTNYGVWASDDDMTASGLSSKDFEINEDSMFTYQGKVVLATANTTRLNRNLKQGYNSHELYDELEFELNGKKYNGIVLDVCGACFGTTTETVQRYDIFTTKNVIGKKGGMVYV